MLDWKQDSNNKWFCYKDNQKIKGWIQDEKGLWYHLSDKDAHLDTGFFQTATDDDFWFYAYPSQVKDDNGNVIHITGEMATGFIEDNNRWYYMCPNKVINYGVEYVVGAMVTDWYQIDGKFYYFLKDSNPSQGEYKGQMLGNCTRNINGKEYTFNSDGSLVENEYILSANGAKFIGSWEGFWEQAQYDPYYPNDKRYITVGFGTTFEAMPSAFNSDNPLNTTCTIDEATTWLQAEAQTCGEAIKAKLDEEGITLPVYSMDSLISFSYNCGTGALFNSTLWSNIISGVTDRDTISANFCAYSKANGITSQGLLKRRKSEVSLYFDGNYTGNN